jgi:hypothetical protein
MNKRFVCLWCLCSCFLCFCTCVSLLVRAWPLSRFHARCNPPLFGEFSSFGDCRPFETFSAAVLRDRADGWERFVSCVCVRLFVSCDCFVLCQSFLLFVTLYTHPLSYKLYIHTYMHKYMHACIHTYIHTFVCIHSYALSLNHTPCFSVYLPLSYFIYTSHTLGSWVRYTLFIFY